MAGHSDRAAIPRRRRPGFAASEPYLAKIERNARIAHAIVDDLMALARGEPAHAEPVLLAEVLLAARETVPEGVIYEDEVVPTDLRVRAHHGLLSTPTDARCSTARRGSTRR